MISIKTYQEITERSYGRKLSNHIYKYWKAINDLFYDSELPAPLVTFEIQAFGHCIGLTNADKGHIRLAQRQKKPIKYKNGGYTKAMPEYYTNQVIGILLHETIHYARPYIEDKVLERQDTKKTQQGNESSHNCIYWISEIKRIHEIFTGEKLDVGPQIVKRVNGKPVRHNTGSIKLNEFSRYPGSIPGIDDKLVEYLDAYINSYSD